MAEMKMVPIHPDFKMDDMTDKLIKLYQAKGFVVMHVRPRRKTSVSVV